MRSIVLALTSALLVGPCAEPPMHIARRRARSSRQNILSKNAVPASFAQNVFCGFFGAFCMILHVPSRGLGPN